MATKRRKVAMRYDRDFGEEFEDHMLAVLAKHSTAIIRYRSALHHAYFSDDTRRVIAKALLAHADQHGTLPSRATLIEECRPHVDATAMPNVEKAIKRLYKTDISDADAVLAYAVSFGKRQAMVNAIIESADLIEQDKIDSVFPLIHDAQLVGEDVFDYGIDYTKDVSKRLDRWDREEEEGTKRIPTGIVHFDEILEGGLARGELGVVLALAKTGKSTALINFAYGASCAGYNVAYYSVELDRDMVSQRLDARVVGKAEKKRKTKPKWYREQVETRVAEDLTGRVCIQSYPPQSRTVTDVRNYLTLLRSLGVSPDVLIVDYADELKPEKQRRDEDTHDSVSAIYSELRRMAGEFDCAVWTGSQAPQRVARENDGKMKPLLDRTDFAGAYAKSQKLDVGLSLNQDDTEHVNGDMRAFWFSMRRGADRLVVDCDIDRELCRITSVGIQDTEGNPAGSTKHDKQAQRARRMRNARNEAGRKARRGKKAEARKQGKKKSKGAKPRSST